MNVLGNLIMTGTSITPVLWVYAALALVECEFFWAAVLGSVGLFLFLLGIALLRHLKKGLVELNVSFSSVEVADRESIGLLVLYVIPLLRTSFSDLSYLILVPAGAIFLALAFTGSSYHFNPLLNLLGWHFYKVSTPGGITYVLITRKDMRGATSQIKVGRLTSYTVIDLA